MPGLRAVVALILFLLVSPAAAPAQVVFAVPPATNTYGYCTLCGDDGRSRAVAACTDDGGVDCAPVLDCGGGWAAAAIAQGDTRQGVGLVCEISREREAIALAWLSCMVATNGYCEARLSIGPDGRVNRDVSLFTPSAFILQLLLSAFGKDPGPADGKPGPRTSAALQSLQRDLGLIESGDITPENAWKVMMAFGGRQALIDLIAQSSVGPAKTQMPNAIYAASANPAPRGSLADELLEYDEQTRLFALSLFLRGQGYPCSETALSAETPFTGDKVYWFVQCKEADYDLFLQPDGAVQISQKPKP